MAGCSATWAGWCTLVVLGLSGCQLVAGFEDFNEGAAMSDASAGGGAGGTAGAGGSSSDSDAPSCSSAPQGLKGAEVVSVTNGAGECFFMDLTEVSVGEYDEFLGDLPTATMTAPCGWNDDFTPSCDDAGAPDLPVTCVTWCDAQAYCEWAGKTLCRGTYTAPADASKSDWFAVCSGNIGRFYPYPGNYTGSVCNGQDNASCSDLCTTLSVTGQTGCATDEGILNLSGNVAEWVAECNDSAGASDSCRARGGSYGSDSQGLRCSETIALARNDHQPYVGFRCCAYPGR